MAVTGIAKTSHTQSLVSAVVCQVCVNLIICNRLVFLFYFYIYGLRLHIYVINSVVLSVMLFLVLYLQFLQNVN